MKEFVEKLIGRLENRIKYNELCHKEFPNAKMSFTYEVQINAYKNAIEIVNQLAEEYNNDIVNQLAMKYATCLTQYGVDITEKLETATQNAMALNQAYMRGRQDERDRFAKWQDEYNNGFCEWKPYGKHAVTGHGQVKYTYEVKDWSVCPYCGKKIKVVEPKGD